MEWRTRRTTFRTHRRRNSASARWARCSPRSPWYSWHSETSCRSTTPSDGMCRSSRQLSVTGQNYADHIRRSVFGPAGMTDTVISVYTPRDVPGMAHGYTLINGTLTDNSDHPEIGNPSGGAISTVADMVKFARAVKNHTLVNSSFTDL